MNADEISKQQGVFFNTDQFCLDLMVCSLPEEPPGSSHFVAGSFTQQIWSLPKDKIDRERVQII